MKVQLAAALLVWFALNAVAATYYVDSNSPGPEIPYTNWTIAASNIQDAIDAASDGDLVLVTNGVYQTGGSVVYGLLTNRVAVTKSLSVQSVNGAAVTVIKGYQMPGTTNGDNAVRCVYLTNGAVLAGFTLINGATRLDNFPYEDNGGGVWCESATAIVSNCIITGNTAANSGGGAYSGALQNCSLILNTASIGGGVSGGALNNCALWGNAAFQGGGADTSTLKNCTITGNRVFYNEDISGTGTGGGTFNCVSYNCINYYNVANYGENYTPGYDTVTNCCTTPLLLLNEIGLGNITNEPAFIDAFSGNFRLQTNSPCISVGQNDFVNGGFDLDGRPRIISGTVDMGAYEFQGPGMGEFIGWLQEFGLATDGSADFTDTDGDGANNWQEWRSDTVPTNALSTLRIVSATPVASGTEVTWQSVSTRNYFLERATNLSDPSPFQSIATDIEGALGAKIYTDTTATNDGPYFYRVGVQ